MDLLLSFFAGVTLVYIPVQISSLIGDEALMAQVSRLMRIAVSLLATCALIAAFALALTSWTFILGIVAAVLFVIFALPLLKHREPEADIIVGEDASPSGALLSESLGREAQSRLAQELSELNSESREPVGEESSSETQAARAEALKLLAKGASEGNVQFLISEKYPSEDAAEITREAAELLRP